MKNIISVFLFLAFLYLLVSLNPNFIPRIQQFLTPACSEPITYRIGDIDSRFNLSEKEFTDDLKKAENVWERSLSKNLFEYDKNGKIIVNLIYDERQSLQTKVDQIRIKLESEKEQIKPNEEKYNLMVANFKAGLAELNQKILYWNEQGGAPPEEYDKLIARQEQLKVEAEQINDLAKKLNKSVDQYNIGVDQLKNTSEVFQEIIENKPEEGIYDPNIPKIDIYMIVNKQEFLHTLAHEFGHALGIKHVANPKSIMYAFTTKTQTLSQEDLIEAVKICKNSESWISIPKWKKTINQLISN